LLERTKSSEELQEDYTQLRLRTALRELEEEETQALLERCETRDPEIEAMMQRANERITRQIERSFQRQKRERFTV